MFDYLVKTPFNTPTRTMNKGEALRLSSTIPKVMQLVPGGYLVEANVGLDLLSRFDARVRLLTEKLGYPKGRAVTESVALVAACVKRHAALQTATMPSEEFLAEVEEFNQSASGNNPITKVNSDEGVGEWAGYRCNIGKGCAHGCLYCFGEDIAKRYKRVESAEQWREEVGKDVKTSKCKRYSEPIMFPTTHDITAAYLPAYRCHLYNILKTGNEVLVVTKPHFESVSAICSEFSSFRDRLAFRFTIGSLDNEALAVWEPGAPPLAERLRCLRHAFEQGFHTSISAEPMLGDRHDAEQLYNVVEPFATNEIWFGKMNNLGGFRTSPDPEVAKRAAELWSAYRNEEILQLVAVLDGKPKVKWKDSIRKVIAK